MRGSEDPENCRCETGSHQSELKRHGFRFYVEGNPVAPSVTTDANGVAAFDYVTSGLNVGDHTIAANFEGVDNFASSSGSTTQCVTYKWLGFQPPVLVQATATSGLGIGLFQGKVIPVKVRIADYNNNTSSFGLARNNGKIPATH